MHFSKNPLCIKNIRKEEVFIRRKREKALFGIYHVVIKGNGGQIIFEDEADWRRMLSTIRRYRDECDFTLYGYALMDNHVHILMRTGEVDISDVMRKIDESYVAYYKRRYKHEGHLFETPFYSGLIVGDVVFKDVLKYIHLNPVKAGLCKIAEYPWSSYHDYIDGSSLCDTTYGAKIFKGMKRFVEYMTDGKDCDSAYDEAKPDVCSSDEEAISRMQTLLGVKSGDEIRTYPRAQRNKAILIMNQAGIRISQLSRILGMSDSTIASIIKKTKL